MTEIIKTSNKSIEELKELSKKTAAELSKQERDELIRNMSIRDHLERKRDTDIIEIKTKNDLTDFSIRFSKLSTYEHDKIFVPAYAVIATPNPDPEKSKTAYHTICEILGSHSLDNLDALFWEDGKSFTGDMLNLIILQFKEASTIPSQDELIKFRGK